MIDKTKHLSPHFTLGEFLHNGITEISDEVMAQLFKLAMSLENIRTTLGNRRITITSGYRTPVHNKAVGGAKNSYHLRGMAADIVVEGMTANAVQAILKDWPGGMGLGKSFTHLDIRPYRARFSYGA